MMDDIAHPSKNVYKTAEDAQNEKNGLYETSDKEINSSDFDKEYEKFKDELPVTTFTFERDESGYYGFRKVETK